MPDRLARHLVVGLQGAVLSAEETSWLEHWQPAGVILFSRNAYDYKQLKNLCCQVREILPEGEIVTDHEGGPVSHLARALGRPPAPWTLGRFEDAGLTCRCHAETGARLRAAGIDRILGPVADVLNEPRNPVIGSRAFGAHPDQVARQVVAAVTGYLQSGLAVCLKHWPGHGGSLVDSHEGLESGATETIAGPFLAGLAAGADAVMVGHLIPGAFGRESGSEQSVLPATLDSRFLQESAQELVSGRGRPPVFYCDDVTMGALRPAMARLGVPAFDDHPEGLVEPGVLPLAWLQTLLAAGCERLLIRGIPWAALPLPGTPPSSSASGSGPGRGVQPAEYDLPSAPSYQTVRRRAWDAAPGGFAQPDRDLLLIDASADDRWWQIGQDPEAARVKFLGLLSEAFCSVQGPGSKSPPGGFSRILLASHRPLDVSVLFRLKEKGRLAAQGYAVVMGHPSLSGEIEALIGGSWQVRALHDVSALDLWPGRET